MWQKILAALGLKAHDHLLTSADYEFMKYVTEYGKQYPTKHEFNMRAKIFVENLEFIAEHNAKEEETHTVGINHLMDLTDDEYKQMLGYKSKMNPEMERLPEVLSTEGLADEVNWVTSGAVTAVKNQGQCGSCWSFSSTGAIEGAEFLHGTKTLTSLSEENLVECSTKNKGCKGGAMVLAFMYVQGTPLMSEDDYPYTSGEGTSGACKYDATKGVGKVGGFEQVAQNSVASMKAALENGPVSIAVEADQKVFMLYTEGVLTSPTCGTKLDHGVLAVGYGTEDDQDYFYVKNSWGSGWGDAGYLKIGQDNICGILEDASYPTEEAVATE